MTILNGDIFKINAICADLKQAITNEMLKDEHDEDYAHAIFFNISFDAHTTKLDPECHWKIVYSDEFEVPVDGLEIYNEGWADDYSIDIQFAKRLGKSIPTKQTYFKHDIIRCMLDKIDEGTEVYPYLKRIAKRHNIFKTQTER